MTLKRVVVTGIGALTPIGNNALDYWENLLKGKSGAAPITRFDTSNFKTQFACEVKNLDLDNHFDRKEGRKLDLFSKFAIIVADEAVKDAGLVEDKVNQDRTGVIWGSGIGGIITFQEEVRGFVEGGMNPRFNPFFIPKMISDIAAGHISIKYGFRGPNFSLVSACATSTNSMIDAFNYIRLGKADVIITGGSEAAINESGIGGFNAMHALSTRNDDPMTASRPFDKDRDGFVMGEGAGVVVLENYESAKKRNAKIYAEVLGYGLSGDAYHITAPAADGDGGFRSMQAAIKNGKVNQDDINYINAHGTSTPLGDEIELESVCRLFKNQITSISMSSTKSSIGHLLGAAGAVEAIFCILSTYYDIVPPTLNLDNPCKKPLLIDLVPKDAKNKKVNIALSNSFGFGGTNASVLVGKLK